MNRHPPPPPSAPVTASAAPANATRLCCPCCQQPLQRRHRRLRDRLRALFSLRRGPPLLRYACRSPACGWSGLLRGPLQSGPGYLPQQWL